MSEGQGMWHIVGLTSDVTAKVFHGDVFSWGSHLAASLELFVFFNVYLWLWLLWSVTVSDFVHFLCTSLTRVRGAYCSRLSRRNVVGWLIIGWWHSWIVINSAFEAFSYYWMLIGKPTQGIQWYQSPCITVTWDLGLAFRILVHFHELLQLRHVVNSVTVRCYQQSTTVPSW